MSATMNVKIRILRTTAAAIAAETLESGRIAYLTDEDSIVIGDGSTLGASLPRSGGNSFTVASSVVRQKNAAYTEDFVFGSPQLADDGVSAHDARVWFDKSKGAFRAGKAQSTEWDDANVGDQSVALGLNTKASGPYSCAIGKSAVASQHGQYAQSSGPASQAGDSQISTFAMRCSTGGYPEELNVVYILALDISMAFVRTFPVIPTDTAWAFDLQVIAAQQGMANVKMFRRTGLVVNDGGVLALSDVDTIGTDRTIGSPGEWTVTPTVENSDKTFRVVVVGAPNPTMVRWSARLSLAEVTY